MLVTEVKVIFKAGRGGDGKSSFRKLGKGPDGGNGGKGGDIYLVATSNLHALKELTKKPIIKAENGGPGGLKKKTGKSANDREVKVPLGTVVTDFNSKEIFEVSKKDDRILICRGGLGGRGNWEFRSGANTSPTYAEKGEEGQERGLFFNLKLIADFGLIGFPNAGKSSLLKELTSAKPKIGSYPFTTLEPNLGEINGKIIADIPGLIMGASKGKGLGTKFLKHIEKVTLLFHCVSCENDDLGKGYQIIRDELRVFNPSLLSKPEVILLTKTDLLNETEIKKSLKKLRKINTQVLPISIHDLESIEKLKSLIKKL
ncbi:GTPase ObgE [Patescibacteria group bacterium]